MLRDEYSPDQLASSLVSYLGYPNLSITGILLPNHSLSFPLDFYPDSDPSRLVPHTLNSVTSTVSTGHNRTISLSLDLLSKRPGLSPRAEDSTVCPSSVYVLVVLITRLEGGCTHVSEAHRLPRGAAYVPLGIRSLALLSMGVRSSPQGA